MTIKNEKLREFQEFINYKFRDKELLTQSLTTPQLGKELDIPSYDFLETLGDAVIKTLLILKLYQIGITDSGEITKFKAELESDNTLKNVAEKNGFEAYVFKAEKQKIKDTRILADVFESVCGAIFLDSDWNLKIVEEKMIHRFFGDIGLKVRDLNIASKNTLLEYLQKKFHTNVSIKLDYEKFGPDDNTSWIAKNPKFVVNNKLTELDKVPPNIKSEKYKNKQEADKEVYLKILRYLRNEEV
ncbi:MAG TPA: hypothetical protein ENI29_05245 [bacterium]|nr:hypothetical protein [bacterium]